MNKQTILTRTALLLALMLIFQSLRLLIPLPQLFSMFLIGSLVNATLLLSLQAAGFCAALLLAVMAPLVAYFQQMLLLPVFILPVAAGNIAYVIVYCRLRARGGVWAAVTAASAKVVLLYLSFFWLLRWINLPPKLAAGLLFAMSWPQLVTALAGAALAERLSRRLFKR